ncbi:MAG TPA: hypothetical protein VFH68_01775 [Polyangia bacterium]|nr:hypothetical protein [Polyangia bacterium]
MLETVELLDQRRLEPGVAVPKRLAPPAGYGIQDLASVGQCKTGASGTNYIQWGKVLVVPHLAARMPECKKISRGELVRHITGHLTEKKAFVLGHFQADLTPFSSKRYVPFTRAELKSPVFEGRTPD